MPTQARQQRRASTSRTFDRYVVPILSVKRSSMTVSRPPGGRFAHPTSPEHLAGIHELMMTHFLPSTFERAFLAPPRQPAVDMKPMCFVAKHRLEQGYVCSVCLATFRERHNPCPACQSTTSHQTTTATGGTCCLRNTMQSDCVHHVPSFARPHRIHPY